MTELLSCAQIADRVATGVITREAAVERCNAILARTTVSDGKRKRWTRLRDDLVAGATPSVKAAFAAMAPVEAKPTVAPAPEAKPADAPKRSTKGLDAASLARAANLCAANPELLAAFMQLVTKR